MTFDLSAYFARIGVSASRPSYELLRDIQIAQMRTIPFENIGPFLGEIPDLSPGAIWDKLVASKRGGYCFELNELLGWALKALGFSVRPILARVRMGAPAGGARTHFAWIADVNGSEWLVDAGFGGPGSLDPLRVTVEAQEPFAGGCFRMTVEPLAGEWVVERWKDEFWFPLYGFDGAQTTADDIDAANFYCARSSKSPFPEHLMLSLHHLDGSASLFNRDLKIVGNGREVVETIDLKSELQRQLTERFHIDCGTKIIDALWERLNWDPLQNVA